MRSALAQSEAGQAALARLDARVDDVSTGAQAVEAAIAQGLKLLQAQVSAKASRQEVVTALAVEGPEVVVRAAAALAAVALVEGV